jgi:hypothetical protein
MVAAVCWSHGDAERRAHAAPALLTGRRIGLYHDPDGNEVELFVDDPSVDWRHDHQWMEAPVKPLKV